MKKYLLSFLLLFSATTFTYAQLPSDGYYRVQNYKTERYIEVLDNRGKLDFATSDIDLNALKTFKGYDQVVSNPASVIYAEYAGKHGSNSGEYILYSQGTDTWTIVEQYLLLYDRKDGTYNAYGTNSGLTKYILDEDDDISPGTLYTDGGRSATNSMWYVLPIDSSSSDSYFGISPDVTVGNDYYTTFYAVFPFSFASSGMTAYYISRKGIAYDGSAAAVLTEITTDVIPGGTPVVIKCSSTNPADNKLNLLTSTASLPEENLLRGVYFCNDVRLTSHRNVVDYTPATMRVLGHTTDGALGLVRGEMDYMPANTAYLPVPKTYSNNMPLLDEREYEDYMEAHGGEDPTAIEAVRSDIHGKSGVYTLLGTKISDSDTLPVGLPAGVYIVGGKKVVVQ